MENTVILNNGIEMPLIGYGVYQIPSSITERCVRDALSVGYRSIDTAQCYGNEREPGHYGFCSFCRRYAKAQRAGSGPQHVRMVVA